ncbi:hypothetical protein YDC107_5317 (plasmid) [Escherichia coli]|nr:hypothetical protein YDC107_5317 [Escherichia coli]
MFHTFQILPNPAYSTRIAQAEKGMGVSPPTQRLTVRLSFRPVSVAALLPVSSAICIKVRISSGVGQSHPAPKGKKHSDLIETG